MDEQNNAGLGAEVNEEKKTQEAEQIREQDAERAEKKTPREVAKEEMKALIEEIERSNEIIKTGAGRLKLEKPITARDKEVEELIYDFTDMTGLEYTEAMDGGKRSDNIYVITYRQALNLFAKAAAKKTEDLDEHDIVERLGMTDALEAVQLATLFFSASTRAGRRRILKK